LGNHGAGDSYRHKEEDTDGKADPVADITATVGIFGLIFGPKLIEADGDLGLDFGGVKSVFSEDFLLGLGLEDHLLAGELGYHGIIDTIGITA
jgi:hypothetical protein